MTNYYIKKTSNGEFKEIEKHFSLNVSKFAGDPETLYFDVDNEDIPFLMNFNLFFNLINDQIQGGLMERLEFNNGVIKMAFRDGNIIKNYTFDFNWPEMDNSPHRAYFDNLKRAVYKIVSLYTENPNSSITSDQKYTWLILGILDGDRIPIIENQEELLRIFQVYNAKKNQFLETLLSNVVFYDESGRIIEYHPRLRAKKLHSIKYDVFTQMEIAMLIFVSQNNANELYQEYLDNVHIPRREISYRYVDENGNEVEATPEMQQGTILSLGKELIEQGISRILNRRKK